ncbi:hypothetical protein G7Z17_g6359 [Cylindrodendrum hubeiense]|uniref:RTA1-like protein n=1 Tax=Cylindrodendrum hubeiense TaxID=595255 RepID=A0A9P5H7F5_9HYPO|nr:hypothetical protein G7Z17_g6359 [Cylindrodendrum hubeiense]
MVCISDYKHADWSYYRYKPSVQVNVVFIILFGITTLLHGFQIWKTRTWYLSALVIGGVGRLMGAMQDPGCWTMGPYIIQSLPILLAPALMAASIYMILGRIIELTEGEHYSLVRKQWLTKIFVMGDVLSLLLQSSGGGMMAISSLSKLGEKVIVGGLFVQLIFFGCFIAVAAVFHRRMAAAPTPRASDPQVRWTQYLTTLYVTGILILIRSVFRVIEFIQGNHGALMRSEVYVFVFDGLLMLVALAWMNWFHPGEIGLLLRGDEPIKNGLELVKVGREKRRRSQTMESLSSGNVAMATSNRNAEV